MGGVIKTLDLAKDEKGKGDHTLHALEVNTLRSTVESNIAILQEFLESLPKPTVPKV